MIRFVAAEALIVVVLCGIGWIPTQRLAGPEALPAMFAGCAISLVSAALAGWLTTMIDGSMPEGRMRRGMFAMFARIGIVMALSVAAVLSGEFLQRPLLFWMATAYMALLPLEVRLAIS
jgi:hypothetical protein